MRAVTALVLGAVACALYPDQAGFLDRTARHVGPANSAVAVAKSRVLVGTDANVVALLNGATGEHTWRYVASRDETILAHAIVERRVFVVSASAQGVVLRQHSAADGLVDWEVPVDTEAAAAAQLTVSPAGTLLAITVSGGSGKTHVYAPGPGGAALVQTLTPAGKRARVLRTLAVGGNDVYALVAKLPGKKIGEVAVELVKAPAASAGASVDGQWTTVAKASVKVPAGAEADAVADAAVLTALPGADGGAAAPVALVASHGEGVVALTTTGTGAATTLAGVPALASAARLSLVPVTALPATLAAVPAVFLEVAGTGSGTGSAHYFALTPEAAGWADETAGASSSATVAADGSVATGSAAAKTPAAVGGGLRLAAVASAPAVGLAAAFYSAPEGGNGASARLFVAAAASAVNSIIITSAADGSSGLTVRNGPAAALPPATAGAARFWALPPVAPSAGARFLVVAADGFTRLFDAPASGSPVVLTWDADEGRACIAQTLALEVFPRSASASAVSGGGGRSDDEYDAALALPARITDQIATAGAIVGSAVASVGGAVTWALANPLEAASYVLNGPPRPPAGKVIAPLPAAEHVAATAGRKIVVARTDVVSGGGSSSSTGCSARRAGGAFASSPLQGGGAATPGPSSPSDVTGALAATFLETGEPLWTLATPLARAAFRAAAAGPVATTLVASRPRHIQDADAEVMVVETATITGTGKSLTVVSWVNAATGAVAGSATLPSDGRLLSVARTPAVQEGGAHRDAFALLFDGAGEQPWAAVVPATPHVVATLRAASADGSFVITALRYDAASDSDLLEGLALHNISDPAAAAAGGASAGGVFASVCAAAVPRWSAVLATGTATGGPHARQLLALSLGTSSSSSSSGGHRPSSPAQILGDDSLLLKYSNPHLAVAVVGERGSGAVPAAGKGLLARSPSAAALAAANATGAAAAAAAAPAVLTVSFIDTVTGRTLHVRKHTGASGPVALVQHDNWAVYAYWNAGVKRQEVGVATLYEGAVGPHDLTPWSTAPAAVAAQTAGKKLTTTTTGSGSGSGAVAVSSSSYGAPAPIVLHRSYALPVAVTDVTVTHTRFGMTNTNFLFATVHGGVLSLDRRLLDPRRPSREPTPAETQDGLVQYSPLLPLRHAWVLSYNQTVPRVHAVFSTPSAYESTTFVGAIGVDELFTRSSPAKPFDQLEADYNVAFFMTVIAATGAAALAAKRYVRARDVSNAWK